ncbi:MAG: hypothetical protein C5B59_15625 [Bacteroidetes bacterium]|nr:MAG: hypothetical protein C5B59_15625 [Bacteroidota bacterium]
MIIVMVLLVGLYEKHTGNVVSVTNHFSRKGGNVHYKMISGTALVYFSFFLAGVASIVFRKE